MGFFRGGGEGGGGQQTLNLARKDTHTYFQKVSLLKAIAWELC